MKVGTMECPKCNNKEMIELEPQSTSQTAIINWCACCGSSSREDGAVKFVYINNGSEATSNYSCTHKGVSFSYFNIKSGDTC